MGQLKLGAGSGTTGRWADDVLREGNGACNVTIPKSIQNGNYVLRNEIIALHSAYDVGAAQLYPTYFLVSAGRVVGDVFPGDDQHQYLADGSTAGSWGSFSRPCWHTTHCTSAP
jgi:hypothetical protein